MGICYSTHEKLCHVIEDNAKNMIDKEPRYVGFEAVSNEFSTAEPSIMIGCRCDPDEIPNKPETLGGYRVVYQKELPQIITKIDHEICACTGCGADPSRFMNSHHCKFGKRIAYKIKYG